MPHFLEVSKIVRITEAENRRVVATVRAEREMGNCHHLMGIKFQLCKKNKF